MKFGEHLEESKVQEWDAHYLDYKGLKDLIKLAVKEQESGAPPVFTGSDRVTSLTVARAGTRSAESQFYEKLDSEVSSPHFAGGYEGNAFFRDQQPLQWLRV